MKQVERIVKLTKEDILYRINEINLLRFDNEVAHILEDALYSNFITCLSNGVYTIEEVIELANIVKSTEDIDFTRWYA